jgi:hypothetical protein
MTTRSATPPDAASGVWSTLHESVTGQDCRRIDTVSDGPHPS